MEGSIDGEVIPSKKERFCVFCGKPEANSWMSGKKEFFCNHRCASAHHLRLTSGIAIVFWILLALFLWDLQMMFQGFIDHFIGNVENISYLARISGLLFAGLIVVVLLLTPFSITYAAIAGWRLKRERFIT